MQTVSDVVIQKSTREGFGLVITEALWKGTPVVASNVGGIPTQMVDGETGYLLDPLDFDGFAEKIIMLMQDEGQRQPTGCASKGACAPEILDHKPLVGLPELAAEFIRRDIPLCQTHRSANGAFFVSTTLRHSILGLLHARILPVGGTRS